MAKFVQVPLFKLAAFVAHHKAQCNIFLFDDIELHVFITAFSSNHPKIIAKMKKKKNGRKDTCLVDNITYSNFIQPAA